MHKNQRKKLFFAAALLALALQLSACANPPSLPAENIIESETSLSSEDSEETSSEEIPEPEPLPSPVLRLSKTEAEPGSYIIIRLENISAEGVTFKDFLGYDRAFYPYDGAYYTVIPIKTAAEPGEYELNFKIGDFDFSEKITVLPREFEEQYLTVSESTLEETLESEEANNEFYNKTHEFKSVFSPVPLWNGEFRDPLDPGYKITTPFGARRTFSNGDTEIHGALDMAAKGGTPVFASNSGTVLFADYLKLTGNTVIIDHGFGVISWHYHMRAINVEAGQAVEKGTQIGEVGTTGLSTGNHLHFGVTVNGIFTDPLALIGSKPDLDFWKAEEQ